MHARATDPAVASATRSQELSLSKKTSNGSLPFKKRRLLIESTPPWEQTPQATAYDEQIVTPSPAYNIHSEERIAALALLAAAACFPLTSLAAGSEPQVESLQGSALGPSFMFNKHSERNNALHLPDFDGLPPVTPTGVDTGVDTSSVLMSDSTSRRIHHPHLTAPLPGGCHGRTSRNNSYCRRNPCYNGSMFCKLHYQQQFIAAVPPVINAALSEDTDHADGSTTGVASTRQDKRYTGCDDEVRCLATTTRGRPCAYVSVFATKYCFLHAAYDTNPPPRRGGSGSTPKQGKSVSAPSSEIEGCPPIPDLTSWIPSMKTSITSRSSAGPQSSASEDSCSSSSSSQSDIGKANAPPQLIKCPLPLLSSIPSEHWLNNNVLIGHGPLVNHIGQIIKWGNGWVSLRIQSGAAREAHGGTLHNRRSVELFLLPADQQSGGQQLEGGLQHEDSQDSNFITRCVSKETDEPPNTCGSEIDQDDWHLDERDCNARKVSNTSYDPEEPIAGPCTSLCDDTEDAQDVYCTVSAQADEMISERTNADFGRGAGIQSDKKYLARNCNVSSEGDKVLGGPCLPTSSTLSDCLLQAQNGLINKGKLGLLFGTAALERGRRKVYKPERYEDVDLKSPRSARKTKG